MGRTLETAAPILSSTRNSATGSFSSLPRSSTDDVEAQEKVGPVALAPSERSPLALRPLEAVAAAAPTVSNSGVVSSLTGRREGGEGRTKKTKKVILCQALGLVEEGGG